ncbi:MAG: hypothetical protein KF716_31840 [Anaerolineae bacterium]|nr:hypothetical protein [Anaerolineae bacterium]
MKIDEIKLLYEYSDWINARLLAACARLTPEQYAARTACGNGWGSLRSTMVHLLDSMWQSRITLQGYYKEPLADEAAYDATELHDDAFPTFDALHERWLAEQREMQAYLDTLTEDTLNGKFRYVIPGHVREWVVWQFLLDDIFHATRHRSEAATLLTGYDQSPGDLELAIFLNERTAANS